MKNISYIQNKGDKVKNITYTQNKADKDPKGLMNSKLLS